MENEPVFAIIDATSDLRSRPSQRGHDMALTPSGGLEVSHIRDSDGISLLSSDEGSTHGGQANGSNGVERRGEFKWQGENDFEGMSWWNKPSVSPRIQSTFAKCWFNSGLGLLDITSLLSGNCFFRSRRNS